MAAPCASALRVTLTDEVPCALADGHAQHSFPDGTPNLMPARHQGMHGGRLYVWSTTDAGIVDTLRNAGFHAQCDHTVVKFAVLVTP